MRTHMLINDTYIWATFAATSLEHSIHDSDFIKKQRFAVPSRKLAKEVTRKPDQIVGFLHNAAHRDLFASVFVFLVAQVEAFFVALCRSVLRFDNRRLKTRIPGIDHVTKLETNDIIDAASHDAVIETLIDREMQAVFYSRPAAYFVYLERVIGITLDPNLKAEWIEIKATRDIIVHNSGIVNQTYIQKAGSAARGTNGDIIPFDHKYFERTISAMKSTIGKAESSVRKSVTPKT